MPHGLAVVPVWIILGAVLSILVISILLVLFAPKRERPPDEAWSGIFYSNPDDPALLVPKRYGIGYTLNFGNPWALPVLILILVGATAPFFLIVLFLHRLPR